MRFHNLLILCLLALTLPACQGGPPDVKEPVPTTQVPFHHFISHQTVRNAIYDEMAKYDLFPTDGCDHDTIQARKPLDEGEYYYIEFNYGINLLDIDYIGTTYSDPYDVAKAKKIYKKDAETMAQKIYQVLSTKVK